MATPKRPRGKYESKFVYYGERFLWRLMWTIPVVIIAIVVIAVILAH